MIQLLCHLWGDYAQSSWFAANKGKRWAATIPHVCVYSVPFFVVSFFGALHPSATAMMVILGTHLFIDRFRLARYVAYLKEFLAPPSEWKSWADCSTTGYPSATPPWLAGWLLIIVDNTMHLTINALSLAYL